MTLSSGWETTESDVEDDCEKENGFSKGLELEKYSMCVGNHKENSPGLSSQ